MSFAHVFPFTTLVERKSATFGAKDLSCRETSARIFSHLHAFLTHLPLVSSFRHSFSSSASNAFSRQLFYVEVKLFAHKKKTLLGLWLPGNVLLLRNVSPTTIGAKELNFCVRHGNRCDLFAIVTRQIVITYDECIVHSKLDSKQILRLKPI